MREAFDTIDIQMTVRLRQVLSQYKTPKRRRCVETVTNNGTANLRRGILRLVHSGPIPFTARLWLNLMRQHTAWPGNLAITASWRSLPSASLSASVPI